MPPAPRRGRAARGRSARSAPRCATPLGHFPAPAARAAGGAERRRKGLFLRAEGSRWRRLAVAAALRAAASCCFLLPPPRCPRGECRSRGAARGAGGDRRGPPAPPAFPSPCPGTAAAGTRRSCERSSTSSSPAFWRTGPASKRLRS